MTYHWVYSLSGSCVLTITTIIIFTIIIYLQGFHIEILVKNSRFCGQCSTYPIKLFYTSNMPIILESVLTSNAFIISQMLATCFNPSNFFVKILGVWEVGLCCYHCVDICLYWWNVGCCSLWRIHPPNSSPSLASLIMHQVHLGLSPSMVMRTLLIWVLISLHTSSLQPPLISNLNLPTSLLTLYATSPWLVHS